MDIFQFFNNSNAESLRNAMNSFLLAALRETKECYFLDCPLYRCLRETLKRLLTLLSQKKAKVFMHKENLFYRLEQRSLLSYFISVRRQFNITTSPRFRMRARGPFYGGVEGGSHKTLFDSLLLSLLPLGLRFWQTLRIHES